MRAEVAVLYPGEKTQPEKRGKWLYLHDRT